MPPEVLPHNPTTDATPAAIDSPADRAAPAPSLQRGSSNDPVQDDIAEAARFPADNPNPVFRVTAAGRVLYANRASEALLRTWHVPATGCLPPLWQERCAEVLTTGQPQKWDAVCDERVLQLTCVPIPEARYVNVYASDVTERHRAEQALQQGRDELERRVAERTAELAASREELRAYARRVVEATEKERRAVAYEVHGAAGQSLWALKLSLASLQAKVRDDERFAADFARIGEFLDRALVDVHRLGAYLRPVGLYLYGLVPALQQYVRTYREQSGLAAALTATGFTDVRLPAEVEIALYQIVQEALANVIQHAKARQVSVSLERQNLSLRVTIEDDGRGFDVERALQAESLGLLALRERAAMLGGQLTITSKPGHGTQITLECLLPSSALL